MSSERIMRVRRVALYSGGFIGPFAGGMTASILPELGASFGIGTDEAAFSLVAYLIPFAGLMLVSGRLGEHWGAKRSVTTAYAVFCAAALLCAFAPVWWVFLVGFMLCGIANAFTTPLLLASLGLSVPRERLGVALGLFGAMQSAGVLSAPLLSGIAATFDWRYAFGLVAVVSLLLAIISIPSGPRSEGPLRLRGLFVIPRAVWGYAIVFFVMGGGLAGLGFLVAVHAADAFGSSSSQRGIIVMCGGIAALLVSALAGRAVDRLGERRVMIAGLVLGGLTVAALPLAPGAVVLALVWGLVMCWSQSVQIAVQKQVLNLRDASGAISVVQAFRFFGAAAAPLLILPVYAHGPEWGFWLPGAAVLAVGIAVLCVPRRGSQR